MKKISNKKGFTLVELLAVIVVLAAVMLMAVNSVLPLIGEARTGAFASSANQALDAVSTVVLSDELKGNTNVQCYSFNYLIKSGYLTKIESANDAKNSGYGGIIVIDKNASQTAYTYSIYVIDYSNGYYYAGTNLAAGTISGDDIKPYDNSKPLFNTCADYAQANGLNWTSGNQYQD